MRSRPYRGKGLAIAGLVLSGVWVVGVGGIIAVAIVMGATRDTSGQVTEGGSVGTTQLRPGDCVNGLDEGENVSSLPAVPCAEPHEGEVFATFSLRTTNWTGDAAVPAGAEQGCWNRLRSYAPGVDDNSIELFLLLPTQQSWVRGERGVTCIAMDPGGVTAGSLRD